MDLAQATGTPEEISLGGVPRPVRLLTMREWANISALIKKHCPSPVTRAYMAIQQAKNEGMPIDPLIEERMLDRAERQALAWPPRLGSEAWFDALNGIDGGDARLLHEVLSKTDLGFTPEAADALAPKVTPDEWADLFRVALYGTHPRPKGEAAAATATNPPSPSATTGGR
jgi:hypothetical protein